MAKNKKTRQEKAMLTWAHAMVEGLQVVGKLTEMPTQQARVKLRHMLNSAGPDSYIGMAEILMAGYQANLIQEDKFENLKALMSEVFEEAGYVVED